MSSSLGQYMVQNNGFTAERDTSYRIILYKGTFKTRGFLWIVFYMTYTFFADNPSYEKYKYDMSYTPLQIFFVSLLMYSSSIGWSAEHSQREGSQWLRI